jgi:hypothetical protein
VNESIQRYFSVLIESLYARIQDNLAYNEKENLLLDQLDNIWETLTAEQIDTINKIIKEFKND